MSARRAYRDKCGRWVCVGRHHFAAAVGEQRQEFIAKLLGVTRQAVSRLLAGQIRPALDLAARIELELGIKIIEWTLAPPNATGGCVTLNAEDPQSEKYGTDAA